MKSIFKAALPSLATLALLALALTGLFYAMPMDPHAVHAALSPDLAGIFSGGAFAGAAAPFMLGKVENVAKLLGDAQAKHKAKLDAMDALVSKAETEKRPLTDDERTQLDAGQKELQTLESDMNRYAQLQNSLRYAPAVKEPDDQDGPAAGTGRGKASVSFLDKKGSFGFRNLADFALAAMAASKPGAVITDQRVVALQEAMRAAPTDFHRETGSDEGLMVPPALREQIWELIFNEIDLLNMVDLEPTNSNNVQVIKDESTPWGSAGVQANWLGEEGSQMTPSKLATKGENMPLHVLYAFVLATEELLNDAPRLNARLTNKSAQAIAWKINEAIIWGTGVAQPKGFLNDAGIYVGLDQEGSPSDQIEVKDLFNMASRVLGLGQSIWLGNSDVLPAFGTMTVGTVPVYNTNVANAPGQSLLGRPFYLSEHCETLGTKGDLILMNPLGYYAAIRRAAPDLADSMHLYFDYAIHAFRWRFRMGGQPHLSASVAKAKGANKKSHFVVLNDR